MVETAVEKNKAKSGKRKSWDRVVYGIVYISQRRLYLSRGSKTVNYVKTWELWNLPTKSMFLLRFVKEASMDGMTGERKLW